MYRLLLTIFICLSLSGCVIITIPYFRNYSDKPVELWFKRSENYTERNYRSVKYKGQLLDIKNNTYSQLKDSLEIKFHEGHAGSITVPPGSTIAIPHWVTNGPEIVLIQEQRSDTIRLYNREEGRNSFASKRSGFPIRILYYFDYK